MKNVILGITGGFLAVYMVILSLSLYGIQTRKNELENCLAQITEGFLEEHYVPEVLRTEQTSFLSKEEAAQMLREEIAMRISSDTQVQTEVLACDMEKGLLSVRVTERFSLPGGRQKTLVFAKTAIIDRSIEEEETVDIRFDVDGSVYKVYSLQPGEVYPVPKTPQKSGRRFLGWRAASGNAHTSWRNGMTVLAEERWTAVWGY